MPLRLDEEPIYAPKPYFPVGLPPMMSRASDHFVHTDSALDLVQGVAAEGGVLLVANPSSNFKRGSISPEHARVEADKAAKAEQIFWTSIAQHLGEDVPVYVMSDLVDEAEFNSVMDELNLQIEQNSEFAEVVYNCVPDFWLTEEQQNSSFAALSGRSKNKALKRMDYVLQQIAYVLILGAKQWKKLGHLGEAPYNAATRFAAALLNRKCPLFRLIIEEGTNPYRTVRAEMGGRLRKTLQAPQNFDYFDTDLSFSDSGSVVEAFRTYEKAQRKAFDQTEKRVDMIVDIYERQMEQAAIERQDIINYRIAREIVMSILSMPNQAYLHELFRETGLDRGNFLHSGSLPFSCPQEEEESDESYYVRFLAALLFDDGPLISGLGDMGPQSKLMNLIPRLQGVGDDYYPQERPAWHRRYRTWRLQGSGWTS